MPSIFTFHHDVEISSLDGDQNFFLNVLVGNGMEGSTTFKNPAGDFFSPDVLNVPLGKGSSLSGASLPVVSVVMDINPHTDNMVVSYYVLNREVSMDELTELEPNDSVSFTAGPGQTITFFSNLKFQ